MKRSLLQRIETFLRESAMPPTLFGRAAVHDPRLVSDLRGGRQAGRRIERRVEHFMNNWRDERDSGTDSRQGGRRPADSRNGKGAWL